MVIEEEWIMVIEVAPVRRKRSFMYVCGLRPECVGIVRAHLVPGVACVTAVVRDR